MSDNPEIPAKKKRFPAGLLLLVAGVAVFSGVLGYVVARGVSGNQNADAETRAGTQATTAQPLPAGAEASADGDAGERGANADASSTFSGEPWGVEEIQQFASENPWFTFMHEPEKILELRHHLPPDRIPGLLEQLEGKLSPMADRMISMILHSILAEEDPVASWRLAITQDDMGPMKTQLMSMSLTNIGKDDPQKAWEMAEALEQGAIRDQMLQMLQWSLAAEHPEFFFEKALALYKAGRGEPHQLVNVLRKISGEDAGRAQLMVESLEDAMLRENAISAVAAEMAKENVEDALTWLDRWGDDIVRANAIQNVVQQLTYHDPAKAAELLPHAGLDRQRHYIVSNIMRHWADRDEAAARAWAESLPVDQKNQAFLGLANHYARSDPAKGMAELLKLEPSQRRRHSIDQILSQWLQKDDQEALAYIEKNDERLNVGELYPHVIRSWSHQKPEAAAEFLLKLGDEDVYKQSLNSVVTNWARNNPEKALAWVKNLPESNEQRRAVSSVFQEQASQAPDHAADMVENLPPGKMRDAAIEGLTNALQEIDPAGAIAWTQTLEDEKVREQRVKNISRRWLNAYPDEARQWISSSNLSDDLKKELLDRD